MNVIDQLSGARPTSTHASKQKEPNQKPLRDESFADEFSRLPASKTNQEVPGDARDIAVARKPVTVESDKENQKVDTDETKSEISFAVLAPEVEPKDSAVIEVDSKSSDLVSVVQGREPTLGLDKPLNVDERLQSRADVSEMENVRMPQDSERAVLSKPMIVQNSLSGQEKMVVMSGDGTDASSTKVSESDPSKPVVAVKGDVAEPPAHSDLVVSEKGLSKVSGARSQTENLVSNEGEIRVARTDGAVETTADRSNATREQHRSSGGVKPQGELQFAGDTKSGHSQIEPDKTKLSPEVKSEPQNTLQAMAEKVNADGQAKLAASGLVSGLVDKGLNNLDAQADDPLALSRGWDRVSAMTAPKASQTGLATQTLPTQSINQAIAIAIEAKSSGTGPSTIELMLEPQELGRLRITLTTRETGLFVMLSAERGETLEMLRRNSDDLQANLDTLDIGGAQIGFEHQPETSNWADDNELLEDEQTLFSAPLIERQTVHLPVLDDRLDIRL
ncbi:MAG: flagellar hook-length control protein FliK [Pseudomonadota bacterium]